MSIPIFPILFGEASTGKPKQWSVTVESRGGKGVLTVSHGYVGGKIVPHEKVIEVGKNLGKKNATTPLTQALAEAQALLKKKMDAGYAEAAAVAATGGVGDLPVNEVIATATAVDIPRPMLAQDNNKRGKNMKYPCLAQRKLDGTRCVAKQGVGLFSRNGKPVSKHLTHIITEVNTLPPGDILDGELYSDDLTFQQIVGLVKKKTLKGEDAENIKKIYLCVYDTIRPGTNVERNTYLASLFASRTFTSLRLLETVTCASAADVKTLHDAYVAEGYEGLILRNREGLYATGHRSVDLQKYKEFEDTEYPVVGFRDGEGDEKGCVLWECRLPSGGTFWVRPRGTREDRNEAFLAGSTYIGKQLTVRYQELTTDGVPRFPVGIAFRDYE
jgi:ATP-dependent DNA ligase